MGGVWSRKAAVAKEQQPAPRSADTEERQPPEPHEGTSKRVLADGYGTFTRAAADGYEEAAQAVANADVLVLSTGAGFSADSGLAVYKDIAQVPAYRDRRLRYHDICQPVWLESDPALFYGFWGSCFNDYRGTRPHRGYDIVAKWKEAFFSESPVSKAIRQRLEERSQAQGETQPEPYKCSKKAGAFFLFTSNVDAHSFDHFDACEVRECHGNTEIWQCTQRYCRQSIWRAPLDFSFQVDLSTMLANSSPSDTGLPAAEAGDNGGAPPRVGRVRNAARERMLSGWPPLEQPELAQESFKDVNRPRCPSCRAPARPAILMFGDYSWVDNEAQEARYWAWLEAVVAEAASRQADAPLKVCVVEIGAGKNVPTVRHTSQMLATRFEGVGARSTLVRINMDFPGLDTSGHRPKHVISLQGGGLESLERIEAAMQG